MDARNISLGRKLKSEEFLWLDHDHSHRSSLPLCRMIHEYLEREGVLAASAGWQRKPPTAPGYHCAESCCPPWRGWLSSQGQRGQLLLKLQGLVVRVAATADAPAGSISCGCLESHAAAPVSLLCARSIPCPGESMAFTFMCVQPTHPQSMGTGQV